jgi:Ca2+-binding RTX toxin-like protein
VVVDNIINNNIVQQVIQQQQQVQQVLANTTTVVQPPAPPPSTPGLGLTDNFQVLDTAAQTSFHTPGTPYTGSVVGVQNEYVNLNPVNLAITAITPNAFIKSGAGNDALQAYAGRNVLDAGAGSNTIISGTGQDTIIAAVPSAGAQNTQAIVDLVQNFGHGDDVVLQGLSAAQFDLTFTNSVGAYGPELLVQATSKTAGGPTAIAALSGYSTGDLASGRLSVGFSTDNAGNPYLLIHSS